MQTTDTSIIKNRRINLLRTLVCVAIVSLLGYISGSSTISEIQNWYANLNKPSFNPPNYLFGPVWTVLYILMGISISILLGQPVSEKRSTSITLFVIQFLLNLAWSFIFFNQHKIGLALVEIIIMWCCILAMIIQMYKVSKAAALLQLPYLLWVSFASVLNLNIFLLN